MTQQPNVKISYVDRPEISETYADSIEKISFDGQSWRLEFCITRMGELIPPNTLPGKKFPCCRLVLSVNTGLDLANKMQGLIAILKQQGVLKEMPVANVTPSSGGKPN